MLAMAIGAAVLIAWLWAVLLARSRKSVEKCPTCRSNRVRPSWPTISDRLLGVANICAFRCEACLRRFYARRSLWTRRSEMLNRL